MDYYDYGYESAEGIVGAIIIIYLVIIAIALAVGIVLLIAQWKVFKKAGYGGWEVLIPIYNTWILFKISGLNWWWFLLLFGAAFIPGIGSLAVLFVTFNCYYNIAKKFNKDTGFAVCLTLFAPICFPILGFSKNCVYDANAVVSNNGIFGSSQNSDNSNNFNNNYNNYNNYNNSNNLNNNVGVNNVQPVQDVINTTQVNNENVNIAQPVSFCGNCGTKLENGTKFCPNCGKQSM